MTHIDTEIINDNQQTQRVVTRDNDIKADKTDTSRMKVTIYTIDNTVLQYLRDRIKPIITQNNSQVVVPIMYASPERWKSVQVDGVIKDSIGKIQLPAIIISRTNMQKEAINSPVNKYYDRTFYTGWNARTPYDRFTVTNAITPSREYYVTTAAPDYYNITYECMVWTEYMEQMNNIIENISFESDEFWGEPNGYKFRAIINSFQPLMDIPSAADRVVRTKFNITVHGYLLPESQLDVGHNKGLITRKRYGLKKVVTFTEIESR